MKRDAINKFREQVGELFADYLESVRAKICDIDTFRDAVRDDRDLAVIFNARRAGLLESVEALKAAVEGRVGYKNLVAIFDKYLAECIDDIPHKDQEY